MSRSRVLSKLIIPIALFTIYSITLYKTATSPVEPSSTEEPTVQTTANLQSLAVVEENNIDIPRPPQAPQALTTASNTPESLRFVVLTDPKMVPSTQATWIKPDDVILGIVHDGEAQAFPLKQLAFHHVINTRVGGESYLITYCALCGGRAGSFKATIGDTRYTFDVYGIYEDSLALIDRQTASVWNQEDGKVLSGPLAAQEVSLQPHVIMQGRWDEWKKLYPQTTVLPQFLNFTDQYSQVNSIESTLDSQLSSFPDKDARLPSDEIVLGTNVGNLYRAYVIREAGAGIRVINDILDGMPIVIFFDESNSLEGIYQASINNRILSFSIKDNRIVDSTGSVWNSSGLATGGAYAGSQLTPLASLLTKWSSWSLYHPDTTIYGH